MAALCRRLFAKSGDVLRRCNQSDLEVNKGRVLAQRRALVKQLIRSNTARETNHQPRDQKIHLLLFSQQMHKTLLFPPFPTN